MRVIPCQKTKVKKVLSPMESPAYNKSQVTFHVTRVTCYKLCIECCLVVEIFTKTHITSNILYKSFSIFFKFFLFSLIQLILKGIAGFAKQVLRKESENGLSQFPDISGSPRKTGSCCSRKVSVAPLATVVKIMHISNHQ